MTHGGFPPRRLPLQYINGEYVTAVVEPDSDSWWNGIEEPILLTGAPPIVLLALGFGGAWATRGFRS